MTWSRTQLLTRSWVFDILRSSVFSIIYIYFLSGLLDECCLFWNVILILGWVEWLELFLFYFLLSLIMLVYFGKISMKLTILIFLGVQFSGMRHMVELLR